jgi:hypothetical protein
MKASGTTRAICAALTALLAAFPMISSALILDSGDGRGNLAPPEDDPGWAYVGKRLDGPSVIYLGDDWVLTANHVGAGVVSFGGVFYDPIPRSTFQLRNADGSLADLLIFKIINGPRLRPLPITRRSPMRGEEVMLIGAGLARGSALTLNLPDRGLVDGWHWESDSRKRWGTNIVAQRPLQISHTDGSTLSIVTLFDRIEDPIGTRNEAQAASGDSGGALFVHADPFEPDLGWVLAGVMFTVSSFPGQPSKTSFYGDATYSADLSYYRRQIIAAMRPECEMGTPYDGGATNVQALDRACVMSGPRSSVDANATPSWQMALLERHRALALAGTFLGGALVGVCATLFLRRARRLRSERALDERQCGDAREHEH